MPRCSTVWPWYACLQCAQRRAEARIGPPPSSGAWHSSDTRGRSSDARGAAQAMVLTGVCVFVIIMSGVKVVSSHGDLACSCSCMHALARAGASVAQSTFCEAAGQGLQGRALCGLFSCTLRAPRRCMGGTRREPAYGGVCRSMPKSRGSSRCAACRTHATAPLCADTARAARVSARAFTPARARYEDSM